MPISSFFEGAGGVASAAKPIIMCTTEAAPLVLPAIPNYFDLWVTDEASQQLECDSLGAVSRAKAMINVGDNQQLQPNRQFRQGAYAGIESLLDRARSQGAPEMMLTTIRRFRHESLAAGSNALLYGNQLLIPPSPFVKGDEIGLIFKPSNSTYLGQGRNLEEARQVAVRMVELARKNPNASLGVVAFGQEQARAIQRELSHQLRTIRDPQLEQRFRPDQKGAASVFIRPLEQVQGDERDVVLVSTSFAPGEDGKLRMNFGPLLMQEGGDKALNVLFTRARSRCEIFTGMDPEDLDLERSSAPGIKALKEFLSYAKTGELSQTIRPPEPLPTELAKYIGARLEEQGYDVALHYGDPRCYVSIAVRHPKDSRQFIMGILLDDKQYQDAASARDRERLLPEILTEIGWNVEQSCCLGWAMNPEAELKRILLRLAELETQPLRTAPVAPPIAPPLEIKREAGSVGLERAAAPAYVTADLTMGANDTIDTLPSAKLTELVRQVARTESPVHISEIQRRLRDAAGLKRLSQWQIERISEAVSKLDKRIFQTRDDFVYLKGASVPARDRSAFHAVHKQIDRIAPEEIEAALIFVARYSHGIKREDILNESCKVLGWAEGVPKRGQELLEARLELLLKHDGVLSERDGWIVLTPERAN
jgi:hypothetical protein